MSHSLGKRIKSAVASGMKQGKQLLERSPAIAEKETHLAKAFRLCRSAQDVTEKAVSKATPEKIKAAIKAMEKTQRALDKAYKAATKGQ